MMQVLVLGLVVLAAIRITQLVLRWRASRSSLDTDGDATVIRCGFSLKRGRIPLGGTPYPLGSLTISEGYITVDAPMAGVSSIWGHDESSVTWTSHPSGGGSRLRLARDDHTASIFVRNTELVERALDATGWANKVGPTGDGRTSS